MPIDEVLPRRKKGRATRDSRLNDRLQAYAGETKGPAEPRLIYNPKELFALIDTMNAEGGAVLFGTTSDGGVLTVTTYLGQDKHTSYIGSRAEWIELFNALVDSVIPSQLEGGKDADS